MRANRYLNMVLTIIAIELGWMALTHSAVPVSAQQQMTTQATPVVITGINMPNDMYLRVGLMGQVRNPPAANRFQPVDTTVLGGVVVSGPVDVRAIAPVKIEADRPIKVEADPPLKVQIPVTSSQRPGL